MILVGKMAVTMDEQTENVNSDINPTMIITTDAECEISINDNLHYQTYQAGELIPLQDHKGIIGKLYYKTLSGTAIIRYWVY